MLGRLLCLFYMSVFSLTAMCQSTFNINLDYIRQSVVFLHVVDESGKIVEVGTAFLISVPLKSDPGKVYVLLATARHMADPSWIGCPTPHGTLEAVFNKRDFDLAKDASGTISAPVGNGWTFPDDDSEDVAVAQLDANKLVAFKVDSKAISIHDFPSPEELKTINVGAQITSAGLLVGTAGLKRNYPAFKFGYVSSIPDEPIPVGCNNKSVKEWLLAASLVGGNSGSPIFFVPVGFPGLSISNQRAFLLGIQSSSFEGADVAGMAPVNYLMDAIRKLNLPDADIPQSNSPNVPTAGTNTVTPPVSETVIPTAHPK